MSYISKFFALLLIIFSSFSITNADEVNLSRKFSNNKTWIKLGHWQVTSFGTYRSTIRESEDTARYRKFFLSQEGRYSPEKELLETLKNISNKEIFCLYPARYRWVKSVMPNFYQKNSKDFDCKEYQTWLDGINPSSVSLIFPGTYLNNPASAFGHTFLKFSNDGPELTHYAVNYSADVNPQDDAISYAFKGVFGGYYGLYSVMPYHMQVATYSNVENRELWEYELQMDQEDVDFLIAHVYELRRVPLGYYYFDENCSYRIDELLSLVSDKTYSTINTNFWVLPIESVHANQDIFGVEKVGFRPSLNQKLRGLEKLASADTKSYAKCLLEFADNCIESTDTNISLAYELANTSNNLYSIKSEVDDVSKAYELLRKSSKLNLAPISVDIKSVPPQLGHSPQAISASYFYRNSKSALNLGYRAVYHSLVDPPAGHLYGSELELMPMWLSVDKDGVTFNELDFVRAKSLSPVSRFINPWSWEFISGFSRRYKGRDDSGLIYNTDLLFGKSFLLREESGTIANFSLGPNFKLSGRVQDNYSLGLGGKIGLLTKLFNGQLLSEAYYFNLPLGLNTEEYRVNLEYSKQIFANTALRLGFKVLKFEDYSEVIPEVGIRMFF